MTPLTASFRVLWHFHILRKQHFKTATTGVATKNMRNELNRLVNSVSDTKMRKACIYSVARARYID